MSSLPRYLDFQSFTRDIQPLNATIDSSELEHFFDLIEEQQVEIQVDATFYLNNEYKKIIKGTLSAIVPLTCQRSLEPFDYNLTADFTIALVKDEEEAERLNKELDPFISEFHDKVDLRLCLEEELVLSIPQFPVNEDVAYETAEFAPPEAEVVEEVEKKPNPFDVLAQLKKSD